LRVDGEGQGDMVAGGKFFSELGEDCRAIDGDLVGEDLVAVFIAQGFAFGVEPAGVHRSGEAPTVHGKREIVAHQRNLVFGRGFFQKRVGARAVRALVVRKLNDGNAGAGGRLEGGGVVHLSPGRRRDKLGLGSGGGHERDGGKDEPQAGAWTKKGKAMGKG